MAVKPKPSRKPIVTPDELLRSMIASFRIEGIIISMEEARAILRKIELSPGR